LSDLQFDGERHSLRVRNAVSGIGEEKSGSSSPDEFHRLPHGGERGLGEPSGEEAVEPYDADVLGNSESLCGEFVDECDCEDVVRADDGVYVPGDDLVVRYGEGVFIGYRGYDASAQEVAFPFGYGLSYTTFQMSDLRVQLEGSVEDGSLTATVTVTVMNTGDFDGSEVVQVYVGDRVASVARPPRELRGFQKVFLPAGVSKEVSVRLDQRAFSYWSPRHGRWVVESGDFTIEAGRHSRDLALVSTVAVDAPSLAEPLTPASTLGEWLADPLGRSLIEKEVANGQPGTILETEVMEVLASMPLVTLSTFTGVSLDYHAVHRVHAAWETCRTRP
jgi:beta-glucosidase